MKLNKKVLTIILCTIILLLVGTSNTTRAVHQEKNRFAHTLHTNISLITPINITSDEDFSKYAYDGSGREEDPYIIEGYEITGQDVTGIYIANTTKYFIIRDCVIEGTSQGIHIVNVSDGTALITNNICKNIVNQGIIVENTNYAILHNNTCSESNMYGIHSRFSDYLILEQNTCNKNGMCGIFVDYSTSTVIRKNIVIDNVLSGIIVQDTVKTLISQNYCFDNDGMGGIVLSRSLNATIINNICVDDFQVQDGINLYNSDGFIIKNNTISYGRYGIFVSESSHGVYTNNTCIENSKYAVYIKYGYNISINENNCSANEQGINLYNSSTIYIHNNSISKNTIGLTFDLTNHSIITFNSFEENEQYAIIIDSSSSSNLIHHNTFVDNNLQGTSQACDNGNNNTWYDQSTKTGNYWSDKKGGKYYIDGSSKSYDKYPLKNPPQQFAEKTSIDFFIILISFLSSTVIMSYVKRNKYAL
ncbi:MAG: right-handed parallel beta-helix repeat-containing protein [Candidatus Heimdallarchaeum aukensis]|uniref:Right-handed parallel beta-helix repeat-containing protein n=1 Tax=Candidatus Heimdallarchaeum aukensis TaxID=2876573 RepID=A0A9Y1BM52_9ARCH|nr:MAG: right-handed parallel beta-helix repeat-containing protein [Candidatus Heimdallarchaeum aukensis]